MTQALAQARPGAGSTGLHAVYDFELMPYALGDVLTWNVQTAIRCEELGRARVDAYVCMDEAHPSSLYQRELVTAENCGLLFSELFGAFGTHPAPGGIFLYRRRGEMLERLRELAANDPAAADALADYEQMLARRADEDALIRYFTTHGHSHERINACAARHGRIPLLRASMGCEPDVAAIMGKRFAGKRIVAFHTRQRRLDAGYGGEHTYARDSDFLEWYDFLRDAQNRHPDVQFVALGRLQEKPLELLRLENVTSLRAWGLGLGHELTLMLHSDLFIGTSSGFAAMANFSAVPYFITKMTPESCRAYGIEPGVERLPFAGERQFLVYEPETRDMLMRLLERGLAGVPPRHGDRGPTLDPAIDVRSWEWERLRWSHPGATTTRFYTCDLYSDKETTALLWPKVKEARTLWRSGQSDRAWRMLARLEAVFPQTHGKFAEFLRLKAALAAERNDRQALEHCERALRQLADHQGGMHDQLLRWLRRCLARGLPWAARARHGWRRKHRIPRKLAEGLRRVVFGSR